MPDDELDVMPSSPEMNAADAMGEEEQWPDNIGDCIDLAYQIRAERLEFEESVKQMKKREENLRNYIFANFEENGIEGARGSFVTASISQELKPQINDWDAVYAYIVENNAFELLERRMSRLAYKERFDKGELVPGTEGFLHKKLNLVKSRR
jgi:hypothetical protein